MKTHPRSTTGKTNLISKEILNHVNKRTKPEFLVSCFEWHKGMWRNERIQVPICNKPSVFTAETRDRYVPLIPEYSVR